MANLMMKRLTFIYILLLTSFCNSKEQSVFFEDCSCNKVDLTDGFEISDSLNYFSYIIPNDLWSHSRLVNSIGTGLTIGDTTEGYIRLFNINRVDYDPPWNEEKEQAQVEADFNIIETGNIQFMGKESRWNLVYYEHDIPQTYSLYLTYVDEENEKQLIRKALLTNRGNVTRAATDLGIDRNALYRRMKKYGIQ